MWLGFQIDLNGLEKVLVIAGSGRLLDLGGSGIFCFRVLVWHLSFRALKLWGSRVFSLPEVDALGAIWAAECRVSGILAIKPYYQSRKFPEGRCPVG